MHRRSKATLLFLLLGYLTLLSEGGSNGSNPERLSCIVFSKNRACQLDLFLRSMKKHISPWNALRVTVLYTATTDGFGAGYDLTRQYHSDVQYVKESKGPEGSYFQEEFQSLVEGQRSNLVALFVDDIVFINDFNLDQDRSPSVLEIFAENVPVLTLSLRLHPGVTHFYANNRTTPVPLLHPISHTSFVWEWAGEHTRGCGDWAFPLSLDGNVYRKNDLLRLVTSIEYTNPNTLELNMIPLAEHMRLTDTQQPLMMALASPVLVNIPLNRVQHVHSNRFNAQHQDLHSSRGLNTRFLHGERLEIPSITDLQPHLSSVHVDVSVSFESQFPGKSYVAWDMMYVSMHSRASALFATEENEECVDLIYVRGHHWYWSVRDSIHYRSIRSMDYSNYVLMLGLLGDDEHSLCSFVTLQEDLEFSVMPPVEAIYDSDIKKLVITSGVHRASILLHRNYKGFPLSKLKISYDSQVIGVVKDSLDLMYSTPSMRVTPYHTVKLGENVHIAGTKNTTYFASFLSQHINFDGANVLEVGSGIGGNLMALVSVVDVACGIGVLDSTVAVDVSRKIADAALPWAPLNFYQYSEGIVEVSLFPCGGSISNWDCGSNRGNVVSEPSALYMYDVLIINKREFVESDWGRVCVFLKHSRVIVMDDGGDGQREPLTDVESLISECGSDSTTHLVVKDISLSAVDVSNLGQSSFYIIENTIVNH